MANLSFKCQSWLILFARVCQMDAKIEKNIKSLYLEMWIRLEFQWQDSSEIQIFGIDFLISCVIFWPRIEILVLAVN